MRILFDHNIPSGTAQALAGHDVTEAIERSWERLSNGELLAKAEATGFDVLLTADKRIRYQQNLKGRKIAIVVIGNPTWRILRQHFALVAEAVALAVPGSYMEIEIPLSEDGPPDPRRFSTLRRNGHLCRESAHRTSAIAPHGERLYWADRDGRPHKTSN